jgi:hypothetical protein
MGIVSFDLKISTESEVTNFIKLYINYLNKVNQKDK